MGNINITELFLYKWRYKIGYGLVAISLIAVLMFAGLYSTSGISSQEIDSVIKSSSINYGDISSVTATNIQYHLLQQGSLALFGLSAIAIKLPSIILAFLSAIGIILILKQWFKANVGVVASLIAITTGQFLFIAQDGTPGILYLFWPVCLILLAGLIARNKKYRILYMIIFSITAASSLYTPLSIYMIVAMFSAILLHPHLRYLLKQISKKDIMICLSIGLIILIPLIISILNNPNKIIELLGLVSNWPNFNTNIALLADQYLGFMKSGGTSSMTPFFGLGSTLLILIGIYNIIKNRAAVKSYIVALWLICLIPVLIINPGFTNITFLPLVLLLASGLNALLGYWYTLFPHNPYARIGGLIPIVALSTVLVLSGVDRYVYGYRYDPNIAPNFSNDLRIMPKDTKNILVTDNELPFYKIIAKYNKNITVITTIPEVDTFLTTREAKQSSKDYKIDKIITSPRLNNSDRFYLYKKLTD